MTDDIGARIEALAYPAEGSESTESVELRIATLADLLAAANGWPMEDAMLHARSIVLEQYEPGPDDE